MNGNTSQQLPQTTSQLLLYILKKIPERLLKAIPLTIAIAVIAWLLHTFLLVGVNQGFAPDTWLGQNILNVSGKLLSSTLLWTMIGFMIPIIISGIARKKNPFTFFTSFILMPKEIYVKNKATQGRLLPVACFSCAVLLCLNGFLSGLTTALAGGIFMSSVVSFVTGGGGIFVQVIRMIFSDIQMFALKKKKFSLDNDSAVVIIGASGMVMLLFGVLKSIFDQPNNYYNIFFLIIIYIINWAWVGFGALGVVLLVMRSNNTVAKQFMFLFSIIGLALFFADMTHIRVLADDGGWVEAGGNLGDWITSAGATQATAMGLPPAIGGVIGSYISSALSGLFSSFGLPTDSFGGGGSGYPGNSDGYGDGDNTTGPNDDNYPPENQIETKPDGTIIITKPDGSKEGYSPDGTTAQMTADGVSTMTSPDGTVTIEYPDGSATQTDPDGTKTTLSADGIQTTYNKDGSVLTENPDGTAVQQNTDGTTTTLNKDGSQTIGNLDGTQTTIHEDGRMTLTDQDGTARTYDKDNHLISKTLPNGATGNYDPDGNLTGGTMPDGAPITVNADGSMNTKIEGIDVTLSPDGSVTGKGTMADGTQIDIKKDGSISAILPGGDSATFDSDGNITEAKIKLDDGRKIDIDGEGNIDISNEKTGEHAKVNADGSATYKGPDGTCTVGSDGSIKETYTDGGTSTLTPDGHVTVKQPDGTTWNANPDGTGTAKQPDGTVWTANKDGTTDIVKTDGTRVHVDNDQTIHINHPDGKTETIPPANQTKGGR